LAAAAVVATALSAALQRTDAGEAETMVTLALLATACSALWLAPAVSPRRAAALALCAAALVVAGNHGLLQSTLTREMAEAAGPLVVTLGAVALMRRPATTAIALLGGLTATFLWLLLYDPFLDPGCEGCAHVALALWPRPGLADGVRIAGLAVVAAAALWEAFRGEVALVGLALAATWLAGQFGAHPVRQQVVVVCAGYVAVTSARRCAIAWRRRAAVQRLFAVYVQGRGLAESLRAATGDAELEVTYPMADGSTFVDVDGNPAQPDPALSATDVRVHGEWLARVHHSQRVRLPDLDAALEPTAAVMLDNERLTAQLAARVAELDTERRAVVTLGLETRNALERDLHDGVQQELLALGLDIRLAIGSLPDDSADRQPLQEALDLVHDAVERVRAVSAGVAPPLLAIRGLSAAITALVRRTAAPIELGVLPSARLPGDVEQAGYAVRAEAIARGATSLQATVHDHALAVCAEGSAPGVDGVLPDLVAALGGTFLSVDGRIEAVIPCASLSPRTSS